MTKGAEASRVYSDDDDCLPFECYDLPSRIEWLSRGLRRAAASLLIDAIDTATKVATLAILNRRDKATSTCPTMRDINSDRRWIYSNDRDVRSFLWCCRTIGLNATEVRAVVTEAIRSRKYIRTKLRYGPLQLSRSKAAKTFLETRGDLTVDIYEELRRRRA